MLLCCLFFWLETGISSLCSWNVLLHWLLEWRTIPEQLKIQVRGLVLGSRASWDSNGWGIFVPKQARQWVLKVRNLKAWKGKHWVTDAMNPTLHILLQGSNNLTFAAHKHVRCWNNSIFTSYIAIAGQTYTPGCIVHWDSHVDCAVSASSVVFYISFAVEPPWRASRNRGWPAGWDHHLYLTHSAHKACQEQRRTHTGAGCR